MLASLWRDLVGDSKSQRRRRIAWVVFLQIVLPIAPVVPLAYVNGLPELGFATAMLSVSFTAIWGALVNTHFHTDDLGIFTASIQLCELAMWLNTGLMRSQSRAWTGSQAAKDAMLLTDWTIVPSFIRVSVLVNLCGRLVVYIADAGWFGDIFPPPDPSSDNHVFLMMHVTINLLTYIVFRVSVLRHSATEAFVLRQRDVARRSKTFAESYLFTYSHEVKNPLAAVIVMLEDLLQKQDFILTEDSTPAQRERRLLLRSAAYSCRNLLQVLHEALAFSQLRAKAFTLSLTPTRLIRHSLCVCRERVEMISHSGGSIRFVGSVSPSLLRVVHGRLCEPLVKADRYAFELVLQSLLSNAIKFSPQGSCVRVNMYLTQDISPWLHHAASHRLDHTPETKPCAVDAVAPSFQQVYTVCEVIDSGVGISADPSARQSLFQAFFQQQMSSTREFGGTGLGLQICKGIIDQMDGVIDCQPRNTSQSGQSGSIFWFACPVAFDTLAGGTDDDTTTPSASDFKLQEADFELSAFEEVNRLPWRKLRDETIDGKQVPANREILARSVLCVDDDSMILEILRTVLEANCSGPLRFCSTGAEALLLAEKTDFDIAIVDWELPDMTGMELANQLKGLGVPLVIGHSAHRAEDVESSAFDRFVTKPMPTRELVKILKQPSQTAAAAADRQSSQEETSTSVSEVPAAEEFDSISVSVDDGEVVRWEVALAMATVLPSLCLILFCHTMEFPLRLLVVVDSALCFRHILLLWGSHGHVGGVLAEWQSCPQWMRRLSFGELRSFYCIFFSLFSGGHTSPFLDSLSMLMFDSPDAGLMNLEVRTAFVFGSVFMLFGCSLAGVKFQTMLGDDFEAGPFLELFRLAMFVYSTGSCVVYVKRQNAVNAKHSKARDLALKAREHTRTLLSTLSHEIRTPIGILSGAIDVLREWDAENGDKHMQSIGILHTAKENIVALVDQCQDMNQIETGEVTLRPEPFNCSQLVEQVCNVFRGQAGRSGIELKAECQHDLESDVLLGDVSKMRQVLINFLANSIRFTPTGGTISITAAPCLEPHSLDLTECGTTLQSSSKRKHRRPRRDSVDSLSDGEEETLVLALPAMTNPKTPNALSHEWSEQLWMRIDVSDSGVGISQHRLLAMFEPFQQLSESGKQRQGGAGLGLAISVHLVKGLGGKLEVESEVGHGTTISLIVPVRKKPHSAPAKPLKQSTTPKATAPADIVPVPDVPAASQSEKEATILIVEDNELNALVLNSLLMQVKKDLGINLSVEHAVNGKVAVDTCLAAAERLSDGSFPFSLVFMDVHMPVMDGIEATKTLRKHFPQMPIVAVTACALSTQRAECLDTGMNAVITKPVRRALLKDTVKNFIGEAEM